MVWSNLVAGANLDRSGSSAAADTFAASSYSAADSNAAMTAGHYWETVFQPHMGYVASYDTILYRFRRSGTGPQWSQWAYSTNGSTFVWMLPAGSNIDSYVDDKQIVLSSIAALQSSDKRVWFRMYAWGGSAGKSAWGVFGRGDVLTFSGTLVATGSVPPTVAFDPFGSQNVSASNTLALTVAIAPVAESGIQGWSLLPSYAGSASMVGTNFSFTPFEADASNTFVLSVVATNGYGTSTGSVSILVAGYVPPPPAGSYIVTFEDGTNPSYASNNVTLSNKVWSMTNVLIGTSSSDLKIGRKAARLLYSASSNLNAMTIQSTVLSNGIGTISLWYGPYGNNGATAPTLAIEVSENLATNWTEVGEVVVSAVSNLTYYSTDVYVGTPVYVRIRGKSGAKNGTANFDNITIAPYSAPVLTPYDAFLLQYNVTPGDPGTATTNDLDGDGFSNTNEFNAGTNPYDEAVHP